MDRISAPPQNALLGRLADLLRLAETGAAGGPEFLPKGLDVMNLVRQLALPSAETVEKLSYGDPLFRMAPSGTGSRIPMTTDREYLADVVGMVPIAAPAARPSARGMQELVRQIQTEPPVGAISPEIAARVLPQTKIVDDSGKPLVVYHGTQKAPEGIEEFGAKTGYAGQESAGLNWFSTSPTETSGYANWIEGMGNPTVYPVYLDIKKPASLSDYNNVVQKLNKKIEQNRKKGKFEQFVDSTTPEIGLYDPRVVEELKKEGFDGVRWSNAELYGESGFADDLDQVVLPFSSKQIKSAISDEEMKTLLD